MTTSPKGLMEVGISNEMEGIPNPKGSVKFPGVETKESQNPKM
jgi:hypothetical protein